MSVERTIAAVIQMFLSLTAGGQGAVDAVLERDLHLQTRIAKHLEMSSDTYVGSWDRVINSPLHDGAYDRANDDLNSQRP